MKDVNTFYIDALCACYSDVASAFPAHKIEHRRDLETILARYDEEGMGFLTKSLPSLAKAIDIALATGTTLQVPSFARKRGSKLPRFCGWLIGRVFDPNGVELADADPIALKYLRQLLYLFYKLELPYTTNQTNRIYEMFASVDQELQNSWDVPEPEHKFALKYAGGLLHRVLADLCPRAIAPKHGPGSVATGQRNRDKPHFRAIYRSAQEYYPYDEYFCYSQMHVVDSLSPGPLWGHGTRGVDRARRRPHGSGGPCLLRRDGTELEILGAGTAKVVTVPKDSRGPRLISMEPLEIQWLQQGQLSLLVKRFESHWLTAGHVNFSNQEVNRTLAYFASAAAVRVHPDIPPKGRTGLAQTSGRPAGWTPLVVEEPLPSGVCEDGRPEKVPSVLKSPAGDRGHRCDHEPDILDPDGNVVPEYVRVGRPRNGDRHIWDLVTLDMKDASDRVSLQLVQTLFPSNWVEALEATRSTSTVLPTGQVVQLNKFAPMGSAVCFPVEAACFWALALAGIYLRNPYMSLTQLKERVWVYGDDIITYRKDYPAVMQMLERVGLKFNPAKCCTHGSFRESCGFDAYKGINVTPTRISALWCHRLGVQALSAYVDYSNSLHAAGFTELAGFIEVMIQLQFPHIPYSTVDFGNIQFVRPHSNAIAENAKRRIRMRFNKRLHRLEAMTVKPRAVTEKGDRSSWAALLYRVSQKRMLLSDSTEEDEMWAALRKRKCNLKPVSSSLEVGLYPVPRRVTSHRGWTQIV